MRVHKISNVNKALEFIASKGVKLVSIGAEGETCPPPPSGTRPVLFTASVSLCLRLPWRYDRLLCSLMRGLFQSDAALLVCHAHTNT